MEMKRTTYMVTVEHDEDCAVDRFDIADMLRRSPRIDGVTVTETTAVHAKEREVIAAAIAQLVACEKNDRWIDSTTHVENVARELRALMEGKA